MTAIELVDALIADLERLRDEIRWKENMAHGPRSRGNAPAVSTSGTSDPTSAQTTDGLAGHVRRILSSTHRDLKWMWGKKLPEIFARLELDDERGGDQGDGVSAYRGDTTVPAGRPDLHDALTAQHRRIRRGESHGAG